MQVVLAIISLGFLGVIIYFLVSPKSSRILRLAALSALALIALSLGIGCVFLLLNGSEKSDAEPHLPVFLGVPEPPPDKSNMVEIIVFAIFLLVVMGLVVVVALKENRQRKEELKKAEANMFQHSDEPLDLDVKSEEPAEKTEKTKGDFDLEL